jgi:magnesium chelatase subunit I
MKEIITEITHLARKSPEINQRSGVSVRVSIANYETVLSNAIRRAISLGEKMAAPRISDLPYILSSTTGKIELDSFEDTKEEKVIDQLTKKAVQNVFSRYYRVYNWEEMLSRFRQGFSFTVSDTMGAQTYLRNVKAVPGMTEAIKVVADSERPEVIASAVEFILEGLHLNKKLNKEKVQGQIVYRQ